MPINPKLKKNSRRAPTAFRALPSVDALLTRPKIAAASQEAGRTLVTQTVRDVVAQARSQLKRYATRNGQTRANPQRVTAESLESQVLLNIKDCLAPSLRRVINATGVVLHTNLGRAPLSAVAADSIANTLRGYTNLEYDLATGVRGKRDTHVARLFARVTGAEASIVVNNNAAAVFLVLNTLAKDGEVIVSRGELIEIGDGFRIPEIMSASGAIVREVGTTNRTRIADYQRAINKSTRLLLRVHPSNFRISGFTARPALSELVALGRKSRLPVFEDLGSGCLTDLRALSMEEPEVRDSLIAGVDLVSFSGDKLLGGPQAGIIAGRKQLIERVRRNPLFRALRVDKMTINALEVTLRAYLRGALDEIPVLQMIRASGDALASRAGQLAKALRAKLPQNFSIEILSGKSIIGGGATPGAELPTTLISVTHSSEPSKTLAARLRQPATGVPVIARIERDRLMLDVRTIFPAEEGELIAAFELLL